MNSGSLWKCCGISGRPLRLDRSPSFDFSENTLPQLKAAGITYSSSMMDDIWPYRHPEFDVIEFPVQWILDDAPHFWVSDAEDWTKKISLPSEVEEIWGKEFLGLHRSGALTVGRRSKDHWSAQSARAPRYLH